MKQALQALLIAPDPAVRLAIMMGRKFLTIREGHRDYKTGPLMICCHIAPWAVMTNVVRVRHTTVADLTERELLEDGYRNHVEALEDLKKYYPDLIMPSPVTVIEWGDLDPKSYYADQGNLEFYAEVNGLE